MKLFFIAAASFCGCLAIAAADESPPPLSATIALYEKNPHHFYFGLEPLWCDLHTNISSINIDGSEFFLGLKLGYEYLRPSSIYVGFEIFSSASFEDFHATYGHPCQFHDSSAFGFANFAIRFGYTFAQENSLISPFFSIGAYAIGDGEYKNGCSGGGFMEDLPYLSAGMRSQYGVAPFFDLGLNLQLFWMFNVRKEFSHERFFLREVSNEWGGEIGVPFVWHVGSTKKWDIRLEPYFLRLLFSEQQNIYGTHILFGYRF